MGSDASKLLAICLMMLASRTGNSVPAEINYIGSLCHIKITEQNINELIQFEFIDIVDENGTCYQDASNMLAGCYQDASNLLEQSRIEKNRKEQTFAQNFLEFWAAYPRKVGRKKAGRVWDKINPSAELCAKMHATLEVWKKSDEWQKEQGSYIPHPTTWLNRGGWDDELPEQPKHERKFVAA